GGAGEGVEALRPAEAQVVDAPVSNEQFRLRVVEDLLVLQRPVLLDLRPLRQSGAGPGRGGEDCERQKECGQGQRRSEMRGSHERALQSAGADASEHAPHCQSPAASKQGKCKGPRVASLTRGPSAVRGNSRPPPALTSRPSCPGSAAAARPCTPAPAAAVGC